MICRPDLALRYILWAGISLALAACDASPRPEPSIDLARQMLSRGDAVGAEVTLRQLLDQGTAQEDVAAYLGEAELAQGDLIEARRWLAEGHFSEATAGHGFQMLGRVFMQENNLADAGRAFDEAYRYIPDNPELWVDIGRLRYRGGEQIQAVEASRKAVDLGPDNAAALTFRAQLVRDSEGMQAALGWFERAVERNPDNIDLLADYAATLGELGRAREMLEVIRRISVTDEKNPRAYYLQAVLAARAGRYDLAQRLMLLTDQKHRDMPAGRLLSGIVDLQGGNYESAAQTFDTLFETQPDNRRIRMLLARSLALGGNHRELVHRFGDAALRPSGSPYLATLVGRSYEALGDREQASIYLDHAALPRGSDLIAVQGAVPLEVVERRGVEHGRDALSLVRGLIVSRKPAAAARQADAFRRKYPGSADALGLSGDAKLAAGQIGPALADYEQASSVRRPWPLTRRMVASYQAAGSSDRAESLLAAQVRGNPANTEAVTMLARQLFDKQDFSRAAMLLDHALVNGADRDPEVLGLRAQTALRLDDPATARETARRAYDLQPLGRGVTLTYAQVMEAMQEEGASAEALRRKGESGFSSGFGRVR
ncbi:MAG: tetratricopeptide repeat protein [Sphingomonadaceae bacterium]